MRRPNPVGTLLSTVAGAVRLAGAVIISLAALSAATASAAAVPGFGNPAGHFAVPPAGRAVNVSHPDHVIGNGRPASCTSAAVVRDVAAGGLTTFNCGPKPLTIVMTRTAAVP
jgi:hypothetical protein